MPPRYAFTLGQQQLLGRALLGETDEEIGRSLHLSTSTVKKRWSAVNECVTDLDPHFFAGIDKDDADMGASVERKRGAEKRRHLLNYLRQHPEEMHPLNASKL